MSKQEKLQLEVDELLKEKPWTMLSSLGGSVTEVRPGYACGQLPLSPLVMQPTQVFHAGAIVVLADEVASAAIYGGPTAGDLASRPFPYSVQISTNLLSNDPVGPLKAESKVVKKGRMVVVQTEVRAASQALVALVTTTHLMVDLKKTGPHRKDLLKN